MAILNRRTRQGPGSPASRRPAWPLALPLVLAAGACAPLPTHVRTQVVAPGEVPIQLGTPPRSNLTPLEASLACFARSLGDTGRKPLVVGVGEIKDYTGRYSINEGNVVTQGGALMLFSALAKMGGTVRIAERFDPSVAERELAYMDRRQLGNGEYQTANGQNVPWLPYYGGTVRASDYYIVGGITEVNYNLNSGGIEAAISNIGFKGRTYNQSVAIDLRIVDSRTLLVVDAVSLSKQFVGYEVGANTFRFFGIGLVNINAGAKGQEPLQLGIRATIEEAAIRLIGRVSGIDPARCLALRTDEIERQTSEELFAQMARTPAAGARPNGATGQAVPVPAPARPVPVTPATGASASAPAASAAQKPAGPAAAPSAPAKPAVPPVPSSGPSSPSGGPADRSPANAPAPGTGASAANAAGQQAVVANIPFEIGTAQPVASAQAVLDKVAELARQGRSVTISLEAPDAERLDPGQRSRLLDQRIAAVLLGLANRGIPAGLVSVAWRPEPTDSTTYRERAGVQLLAKLKLLR